MLTCAALAGCALGPRPTLVAEAAVNDPAIEAVLEHLDTADSSTFTATYDIIPSASGTATAATVEQTDGRRHVTIGDTTFITDGQTNRTCAIDATNCIDQLDDTRVSNLNITNRFWGPSFASRLRLDAGRNTADGVGSTTTIAGQPATCVDIAVVGGTVSYCALDAGPLARYFGADVSIEMTGFTPTADL